MRFDLLTLLVLRLCVDLLVAAAFLAQSRRHPNVGGPGWWALAALLSALGSVGLGLRTQAPDWFSIGVANTALAAGVVFSWLGLRSYLGFRPPLRRSLAGLLALWGVNVLLFTVWDSVPARQSVFSLVSMGVGALTLLDIDRFDTQRRFRELRALRYLTWLEFVCLAAFGVAIWFMPAGTSPSRLSSLVPALLLIFMIDILLRMVIYTSLVTLRLQQDGDRTRQALQVREADSRTLIENLSAGVMVFRPDQTLSSINSAARRFLGWEEGGANPALPLPTRSGWRMLREDGQPMRRPEMPFERVLATGQAVRDVVLGMPVGDGGDVRWALCNAYPENDAHGGLRHVVLTFVDISSLKAAQARQKTLQAQLAQSQKMEALGTLAGGVAHDFNNILAAILGNADLARQDLAPFAPARESLHEISTAARRGRELVRQIMAFSRRQPMVRTPVYLGDVLTESCSLLRAALPPQIELVQSCARDIRPILADATQLGQVLLNLGTNAIHAMQGQSGLIEFLVDELPGNHPDLPAELAQACAGGAVRVRVRDNGCGMDEATRSRMFEPFFTTKAVGSGTGLGLPVALGIVQSLGGAIDVQTAVGQGTSISLFFPVCASMVTVPRSIGRNMPSSPDEDGTMSRPGAPAAPDPMETPTMADALPTDQRHILYLDDDDTLVFLVRRLLERRGHKVTAFTEQREVIEAVRENPGGFDLLLTDYNMPGMSGLDVAKAVLAINPALPVAVASGYITDDLQAEAMAAGVREVVFKTDAVESFCEVVARLATPRATPEGASPP